MYSCQDDPSENSIKLDENAIKSLELFSTQSSVYKSNKTLFNLMNKTRTINGKNLLNQWMRYPLKDIQKINERLDMVEYFVNHSEERGEIYENYLRKIPDLVKIGKKIKEKRSSLEQCYQVYLVLSFVPRLLKCLSNGSAIQAIKTNFIDKFQKLSSELDKFKEMVENVIDFDKLDSTREFWVNHNYNDELKQLNESLDEMECEAKSILKKVAKKVGLEVEKSIKMEISAQGFILKVTRKNEKEIREFGSFIIEKTKKDGVRFSNPELSKINRQYSQARSDYEVKQQRIIDQVVSIAANYFDSIEELASILSLLDAIIALSIVSVSSTLPYVRPDLLPQGSGKIHLKQVRHPCLEAEENISYIPNDCIFDNEKFKFYIITGPNMGGKSTFIKSVGICVLMAQIGCFVPAESALISIVDGIYTRIGAGDNLVKGISTFMAEMVETAAILNSASSDSLIIIDELGRGTSTFDGFGLAWSISEHIAKQMNAYTLFASHFNELTDLAKEILSIGNLHLTAMTSTDKLTMLYKVNEGVCDKSFGIHVAEMVKFPIHIIEEAKRKLQDLEGYTECNIDWNNDGFIEELVQVIFSSNQNLTLEKVRQIIHEKLNDEQMLMEVN